MKNLWKLNWIEINARFWDFYQGSKIFFYMQTFIEILQSSSSSSSSSSSCSSSSSSFSSSSCSFVIISSFNKFCNVPTKKNYWTKLNEQVQKFTIWFMFLLICLRKKSCAATCANKSKIFDMNLINMIQIVLLFRWLILTLFIRALKFLKFFHFQ